MIALKTVVLEVQIMCSCIFARKQIERNWLDGDLFFL